MPPLFAGSFGLRRAFATSLLVAAPLLAAVLAAGCAQLVTFDEYTYDIDPCGPQPPACAAAGERYYVFTEVRVPPASAGRVRDGFDLDGTDEPVCGQPDFTSPRGERGIDNQTAGVIELYESLVGIDVAAERREAHLRGEDLLVLALTGLDDLSEDDCVEVTVRGARVPEGTELSTLDADGDGLVDAGLTFDLAVPTLRDGTACIRDGVVHARFGTTLTRLPGFAEELRSERGRMRMPITASDARGGIFGGAVPLEDLARGLPAEILEFLRGRADISPSERDARDCASISWALALDAVEARRGASF
jgi:hypothetical protein